MESVIKHEAFLFGLAVLSDTLLLKLSAEAAKSIPAVALIGGMGLAVTERSGK